MLVWATSLWLNNPKMTNSSFWKGGSSWNLGQSSTQLPPATKAEKSPSLPCEYIFTGLGSIPTEFGSFGMIIWAFKISTLLSVLMLKSLLPSWEKSLLLWKLQNMVRWGALRTLTHTCAAEHYSVLDSCPHLLNLTCSYFICRIRGEEEVYVSIFRGKCASIEASLRRVSSLWWSRLTVQPWQRQSWQRQSISWLCFQISF